MNRSQTPSEPRIQYSDFSESDSTPPKPQIEELSPSSSPPEKADAASPQKPRKGFPVLTKESSSGMIVEPKATHKDHDKDVRESTTEEKHTYLLFATSKHGRKVSLPIRKGIYRIGK